MDSSIYQDDGDSSNPIIAFSSRGLAEEGSFGENNSTTALPQDGSDVQFSTNMPLFYIGVILNSLSFLGCMLSIIFIIQYRKRRALTTAQPFFLGLICLASATVATSGILLDFTSYAASNNRSTQEELDHMCFNFPYYFFGGSIALYMALFAKTWRLQKVTQLRRNQTVKCYHVLWPLFVADAVTSGALAAWAILAPPVWKIEYVETESIDQDGNEIFLTKAIGYCDYAEQPLFPLLMLALMAISAFLGYWMGRKIPESVPHELNDGKEIRWVYLIHIVILLGCEVLIVMSRLISKSFMITYQASFVTILLVFPFTVTSIALLIAPKCYSVFLGKTPGLGSGTVTVTGLNGTTSSTNVSSNAATAPNSNPDNDDIER